MGTRRLNHLECARGIASVVVLFHHFCYAFVPDIDRRPSEGGLGHTPAYILVNGSGAVIFFFLLSGFVLTLRFYARPTFLGLLAAVIKRLPRLMVPAGASILIGLAILLHMHGAHEHAAAITRSGWLREFGNANFPPGRTAGIGDALRQSLFVFLRTSDSYYNSNLWTMVTEFYGSLLVFGVVGLFALLPATGRGWSVGALHAILFVVLTRAAPFCAVFVAGSFLAYLWTRRRAEIELPRWATAVLLCVGSVGFISQGWAIDTIAAICVMLALLGSPALATRLSGRVGVFLGAMSFPLYLVHTLVILSISSAAYVWLAGLGVGRVATGTCVLVLTFAVSTIASIPFLYLDKAWMRALRHISASVVRLMPTPATEARVASL